jgi:hypothetical protein
MSEFVYQPERRSLDDVLEAIDHDSNIGYACRDDESVMAFGGAFIGDTGILYAQRTEAGVEMQQIVLYHNQEPALVAWLLASITQGMTSEERVALHDELMTRIAQAETEVRPPEYHHESFATQYWGEESARLLHFACVEPDRHPKTHWWHDAATMDASRPSIRMDMLADSGEIRITDEFEERSFVISYASAMRMAIGLTVYDRGRIRPDIIKQVYDGLLSE